MSTFRYPTFNRAFIRCIYAAKWSYGERFRWLFCRYNLYFCFSNCLKCVYGMTVYRTCDILKETNGIKR